MTEFLAAWGAVISTLLLGMEIKRFYYEGVRLKVEVRGGYNVHPPVAPYYDKKQVMISISNKGHRSATITHVWLLTSGKTTLFCKECLTGSRKLSEGDYTQYVLEESQLKEKYGLIPRDYMAVASDAVGRKFYSHNLPVRIFKIARMRLFSKK